MTDATVVKVEPCIDIQVVFGADGGRSFQMRFAPLPLDTSSVSLNEALDRVLAAVDRQNMKYALQDEESRLKEQEDRISKFAAMNLRLDARHQAEWEAEGRKGPWNSDKLPPSYRNAKENTQITIEKERAEAEARKAKIAHLRDRVNGHADDGSADSRPG